MGEIQVSIGDPDGARQHFLQALQLVHQQLQQHQSSISWSLLESNANICLYIGQLSMEHSALEAYILGVSSLEEAMQLWSIVAHTDTDTVMGTDEVTTQQPSHQQRQETIQQLHHKLSSAYCTMADLYLTDLCDEETAENLCQHYLEKALQLKSMVSPW
jgi:hypothetical protein